MSVPTNRTHRLTDEERTVLRRLNELAPAAAKPNRGDRVSACIVLFGLAYFSWQAVRVGLWVAVIAFALPVAAVAVRVALKGPRPRPRNRCGG